MATSQSKVTLKLLIDKKGNKFLFAEAGKEFIDFLFYLFSLPLGNVVKLLRSKGMVGCLGNLYNSIENLSETYMQPKQNKNLVLNPKYPICATGLPLLLSDHESKIRKYYTCPPNKTYHSSYNSSHYYVTDVPDMFCPNCNKKMNQEVSYISPAAANTGAVVEGGFVKGLVTYTVLDNLEVMPMSTISSISLLNKLNVKDLGALEERVVHLSIDEGLKLLKASLECKTALTSVFLGNVGVTPRKRGRT